jgi:trehalose synthase-fused probable maltokinase
LIVDAASHLAVWSAIRKPLEQSLPGFISGQRWFGGKTRVIRVADVVDFLPVPLAAAPAAVVLARVQYADGLTETYSVPLVESAAGDAPSLRLRAEGGAERVFSDALWHREFLVQLLDALAGSRCFPGQTGELAGLPTPSLETIRRAAAGPLEPSVMRAEQSNTSILYGRSFVLKFFRHVEEGVNPDFEVGEFLSVRAGFRHIPPAAGSFEYRRPGALPATLGFLQGFVPNRGDAWRQTLDVLNGFYERAERSGSPAPAPGHALPADLCGESLAAAGLLGRRTAELHLALASDPDDPEFAPEPFTLDYQREVSSAMIRLTLETFGMLRRRAGDLPGALRERVQAVLGFEEKILTRFHLLAEYALGGLRTRIHGDLHLGQVLASDNDFVFIDFEGEPARTLAERRAKHSPVRDVAGMMRSFHYAAYAALFGRAAGAASPAYAALAPFAAAWYRQVSGRFLESYLETAAGPPFLPPKREEFDFFLALWLLDKAVYELKYELNHRVDWMAIPLEGIGGLMEGL